EALHSIYLCRIWQHTSLKRKRRTTARASGSCAADYRTAIESLAAGRGKGRRRASGGGRLGLTERGLGPLAGVVKLVLQLVSFVGAGGQVLPELVALLNDGLQFVDLLAEARPFLFRRRQLLAELLAHDDDGTEIVFELGNLCLQGTDALRV